MATPPNEKNPDGLDMKLYGMKFYQLCSIRPCISRCWPLVFHVVGFFYIFKKYRTTRDAWTLSHKTERNHLRMMCEWRKTLQQSGHKPRTEQQSNPEMNPCVSCKCLLVTTLFFRVTHKQVHTKRWKKPTSHRVPLIGKFFEFSLQYNSSNL